jgi:hypothetical protein
MIARLFAIASLVLAGCAQLPPLAIQPQSDWDRALGYARQDAAAGNYFAADRVLAEYIRTHPDTREARETEFWRAVYLIDPANPQGSLASGIAALDAYLATDSTGQYAHEATILRRTAVAAQFVAALQTASAAADSASDSATAPRDTVVIVKRSRDEEIAALRQQLAKSKDELAKVTAELDRIKKRLANPSR